MYGSHPFAKHWLYFSHFSMFSPDHNSDYGILDSQTYLRVLVSMIITGLVAAMKRMYFALYLGKRMYSHFFPHVKALMENMQLISELADFSNEDLSDFHVVEEAVQASSENSNKQYAYVDDCVSDDDLGASQTPLFESFIPLNTRLSEDIVSAESDSESSTEVVADHLNMQPTSSSRSIGFSLQRHNASGFHDVKNNLDRWKEPTSTVEMVRKCDFCDNLRSVDDFMALLYSHECRMNHPFKKYFSYGKLYLPWMTHIHLQHLMVSLIPEIIVSNRQLMCTRIFSASAHQKPTYPLRLFPQFVTNGM